MIQRRRASTVLGLMCRRLAISLMDNPSARSWRTWRSALVRLFGDRVIRSAGAVHVVLDEDIRDARTEVVAAGGGRLQGPAQLVEEIGLEHVSRSARLERLLDDVLVRVHGQDNHLDVRVLLDDLPSGLDAIEIGHGYIHDDHIGGELLGEAHRRLTVFRFANHLHGAPQRGILRWGPHTALTFDQRPQPLAHDRVIIGDDDSHNNVPPHRSLPEFRGYFKGTTTTTRVPSPRADSIVMLPPR